MDIYKTQATIATSIMGVAARAKDGTLARKVDDKLNLILEELRSKELEFGTRLLPPGGGQEAEDPASLPAPSASAEQRH